MVVAVVMNLLDMIENKNRVWDIDSQP